MSIKEVWIVTGATGLAGRYFLKHAANKDVQLICCYRDEAKRKNTLRFLTSENVNLSNIQWFKIDLLKEELPDELLTSNTRLIHMAAKVDFSANHAELIKKTNVDLTKQLLYQAQNAKLKQFLYLSSIAVMDENNRLMDEESTWDPGKPHSLYAQTKFMAEMEVWRSCEEGLPVVIFNPGIILGKGNPGESSMILFDLGRKHLKYYPSGVNGFVSAEDVAGAIICAIERNITGERFVLVEGNYSYKEILTWLAEAWNIEPPHKLLSFHMAKRLFWFDKIRSILTFSKPWLSKNLLLTAYRESRFDNSKSKKMLELVYKPIKDEIFETVQYLKSQSN